MILVLVKCLELSKCNSLTPTTAQITYMDYPELVTPWIKVQTSHRLSLGCSSNDFRPYPDYFNQSDCLHRQQRYQPTEW